MAPRNPITGIAGCCARAASGNAAAAPPSSVMNSRPAHSITSSSRASRIGGTFSFLCSAPSRSQSNHSTGVFDNVGHLTGRPLQEPAERSEPFTPSDSTALRDTLRPGDVLLVEGYNHISDVIKISHPIHLVAFDAVRRPIFMRRILGSSQLTPPEPRWPARRPLRHPRVGIIRSCDGRKFHSLAIDFLLGKDFLAFSEP